MKKTHADHEREYANALTAYASGRGARYTTFAAPLTWEGAILHKSADEVISDLRAIMPDFSGKDADNIRRGIITAARKVQGFTPSPFRYRHERKPEVSETPDYVRNLIRDGGGECSSEDLRALSPVKVADLTGCGAVAFAFINALWNENEFLHVFNGGGGKHSRARLGVDLRPREEWLKLAAAGSPLPGDCIGKNPYTGREGKNGEGNPSYTAKECVAAYRFALVEFDHLPLRVQAAFWRGFLTRPKLAPSLVSLTFSGGKSIHGLIRTHADALTAPTVEKTLRGLFCSDPEDRTENKADGTTERYHPYRADPQTLRPHGGTRLAGMLRADNGQKQALIYLNPKR